jgi:hypothetical protein
MKTLGLLLDVALCAVALFVMVPATAAQTSTPTPEPTAAATPTASPTPDFSVPPAAPTGATLENDRSRICWTDASNNEEGFTVSVGFCDRQFDFTVGADVTCLDLPPEARISAFPEDCVGAYQFWVYAFNDAGRSLPVVISIPVRKSVPPTPTPAPTVVAPGAGAPLAGNDADSGWALPLLAVGGSLLVLSGGLVIIIRSRRLGLKR